MAAFPAEGRGRFGDGPAVALLPVVSPGCGRAMLTPCTPSMKILLSGGQNDANSARPSKPSREARRLEFNVFLPCLCVFRLR